MGEFRRRHRIAATIITHANIGKEFINAANIIMGNADDILFFNNETIKEQKELLIEFLEKNNNLPIFIFVDFIGSSGSYFIQTLTKDLSNVRIFGGLNLPMFLDFLAYRNTLEIPALIEKIINAGKRGILSV